MRPTAAQLVIAALCLLVAVSAAYLGAAQTRTQDLFSLTPPPPKGEPAKVMAPDTPESKRGVLHLTVFTAWAALILTAPALCAFLFRRTTGWWLAFWTAGLAAFTVHFYWAVVRFFDNDWSRITSSTRVSVAIIDTVFFAWWALDVALAWKGVREGKLVTTERAIVHLMAFVLFFAGAALEGETALSRMLGYALAAAVAVSAAYAAARAVRTARILPGTSCLPS